MGASPQRLGSRRWHLGGCLEIEGCEAPGSLGAFLLFGIPQGFFCLGLTSRIKVLYSYYMEENTNHTNNFIPTALLFAVVFLGTGALLINDGANDLTVMMGMFIAILGLLCTFGAAMESLRRR